MALVGAASCDSSVPAPEVIEIAVTGHDFKWKCRYAGPDGTLETDDDVPVGAALHVPTNTLVRIHLTSDDFIYTLMCPKLASKEVAVPGIVFRIEFDSGAAGAFELRGDQMCGYTHESLFGELVVESPESWRQWMAGVTKR